MKAGEIPTEEWIARIRATEHWQSRDWFSVSDLTKALHAKQECMSRCLRELLQRGAVSRKEVRRGLSTTIRWRNAEETLISRPWRKISNARLGIKSYQFGVEV